MKTATNPFDPFGLMAGGPLAAWHMGWKMIEVWQRAWLPLMKPLQKASAFQASLFPMFSAPPAMPFPNPLAVLFPQVEALLTPLRGKPGDDEAARLSMRVQLPAMPGSGVPEQLSVEALIARRQGRQAPWLGCLQGANVVYPATGEVPPAEVDAIDVEPAAVTRKAVKAVRTAPPAKATTSKAAAPRKAPLAAVKSRSGPK